MDLFFLSPLNKSGIGSQAIYLLRTSRSVRRHLVSRIGVVLPCFNGYPSGPVLYVILRVTVGSSEIDYVANPGSLQTRPRIALVGGDF